jgi:hypothetical protein
MTPEARPQPDKTLSNNITYFGRRKPAVRVAEQGNCRCASYNGVEVVGLCSNPGPRKTSQGVLPNPRSTLDWRKDHGETDP